MAEQSRDGERDESGGPQREEAGGDERSDPPLEAALRNESRRRVLRHLCREGGESSLMSLALRLQSADGGTMPNVIGSLHDFHLPKLERHGVVERTTDSTVELLVDTERLEERLEGLETE